MMRRSCLLATLACVLALLAGCLDFVDPNLPQPGPALAQVALYLVGDGTVDARVSVLPGMAESGDWRKIPNDTLIVNGLRVRAMTVHNNGARDYQARVALPSPAGPVTLQFPAVAGVDQAPPQLRWYVLRRLDLLDWVSLTPSGDLYLHVDTTKPPETPAPANQQWLLQLSSGLHRTQVGADGLPPATVHVPAEFVPADTVNELSASLLVSHDAALNLGAHYILNASISQRMNWIVVRKLNEP